VNKAVNNGPTAMVIKTLATAVSVRATMKAVNMTHQHKPDSQKYRLRQGKRDHTPLPCHKGKMIKRDTTVKKLRQKVTSKLRASSKCRVTTPAMDHRTVQPTMVQTAMPCVMRMMDQTITCCACGRFP
jgi:hypothetical protein